jgi:hypothetical protein
MRMHDIQAFVESLVLFQVVDTGMNDDPPDPTLKCTLVLKGVYLGKYLDKPFLQHIFSILPVVGEPVAYCQHFRAVPIVQLALGSGHILQTAL